MTISKKLFILSGIIFILLLFLWGTYKVVFEKKDTNPFPKKVEIEKDTPISIVETEKDSSIIYPISEETVIAPTLTADGSHIKYYDKLTGNVYQIDLDGENKKTLSSKSLAGLVNILWSPNKKQVISSFSNNSFSYYNYADSSFALMNSGVESATWLNDNKIIYSFIDKTTAGKNISISNPDGSNWEKIADTEFVKTFLASIPNTGLACLWNQPDAFSESSLYSLSITDNEPKKIIFAGKFGANYLWSPDGNYLLISHLVEKGSSSIQLAVTNSKGGEYKNLSIPTLVSKSAWSKDSRFVYYALPGMIPENAIMPNDYFANKFKTTDTLWRVNIENGEKSRIIDLDELKKIPSIDAINLFLSEDESSLFFTNRADGKLYRLDL